MKRRTFVKHSLRGLALTALPGIPLACHPRLQNDSKAFIDRLLPAPRNGGFRDDSYWIWGSSVIKGEDGIRTVQNHFERPFLLIEKGQPTHLFAAVGEGPKAWNFENTWNMVIPLKK